MASNFAEQTKLIVERIQKSVKQREELLAEHSPEERKQIEAALNKFQEHMWCEEKHG